MTREEAIKILKAIRVYECYPKSASEETKEAIDMAIETLSAEAVQGWIPVSERLPDKTGWYVVTVAGLETITDMLFFYNEVSAWSDITDKQKVVAWMPLPEPYKGGDSK